MDVADVQIDNGNFTQIANVLLERISAAKLNGCQYAIILQVWRYTYGFKRKDHELSAGFISKATGYNARQIQRELKALADRNIIFQKVVSGISRIVSFNKDFDTWTTYGELAYGEKDIGGVAYGELDVPPTANQTGVTYGELAVQEIKSFKQNSKEIYIDQFNEFWTLYPNKKGKAKAQAKWISLSPKMDFQKVIEGTTAYIAHIEYERENGFNRAFKDGNTFVNQMAWDDDWTVPDATPKPTKTYERQEREVPIYFGRDQQQAVLSSTDREALLAKQRAEEIKNLPNIEYEPEGAAANGTRP